MRLRFERPHIGRLVVTTAYILATAGLLILAFDHILFDEWAIFGAATITLLLLGFLLLTGEGIFWLGVSASWIYAAIIEMVRGPTNYDRAGVSLIFVALALGALGAYTAYRRDQAVRV